jgi:hypothetical protein
MIGAPRKAGWIAEEAEFWLSWMLPATSACTLSAPPPISNGSSSMPNFLLIPTSLFTQSGN